MADELIAMPLPMDGEVAQLEAQVDADAPIGLFQKPDDELVKQIRLWWKESSDARTDGYERRNRERAMVAGHQWDDADKKRMDDGRRPALTLNLLLTILAAVEGEERTNRQEMKLYGEGEEDDTAAYALNQLIKWVMNQCGGEFALSRQFREGAGYGDARIGFDVDFLEDPEGMIKLVYVKDEECFGDPLSECPVGSDERYFHRVRMYTADEMDAKWPGSTEKLRQNTLASPVGMETDGKGFRDIYLTPGTSTGPKFYDATKKLWAVLETWWTQIEPGVVVVDEATGLLVEKTPAEFEQMKAAREAEQTAYVEKLASGQFAAEAREQQMQAQGAIVQEAMSLGAAPDQPLPTAPMPPMPEMPPPLQSMQRPVRCLYQAFSSHETLLSKAKSELPTVKRIPYVPFRGLFDDKDKQWFGLIKPLVDPQKQHNVEQSAIVQWVQLSPKNAWMAPKGAYHNRAEWEQKAATPGAMLEYNARNGKPEQIQTPALPRHLIDMAMSRPQSMREISGVNVELTGVRQGSDAGVVMEQRSKAARTVLAPIFDNFRWSKKEIGKILLAYIQRFVSVGRQIRVLGPDGVALVQMTQDMTIGRYDVMVEETNATINDRIASLNILQTTLPQMLKAGVPIPPEVYDLLPMEPKIREQMKRYAAWTLARNGEAPPPNWKAGDPVPMPALPMPGAAPGAPPPQAQ